MNSTVYVGMDVHRETYTVCRCSCERDKAEYRQTLPPDYRLILKYVEKARTGYEGDVAFVCGYEAGRPGCSLQRPLKDHAVDCRIPAPTTTGVTDTRNVKTDRRDAANAAGRPAFHTYSEAYVPDEEDNAAKDCIRMRDDRKLTLKKVRRQIPAFALRKGLRFEGGKTYRTIARMKGLRKLEVSGLDKETPSEDLITCDDLTETIQRPDGRTEDLASGDRYKEKAKDAGCFPGIKTHTALSMVVEVGDFRRFEKAPESASCPGLVPGGDSSADGINRYRITKAGNSRLRRLPAEAAQSYGRGSAGHKSKALKQRRRGGPPEGTAYADRANERLRRRFYRTTLNKGINRNAATTAAAGEPARFIWGMMTEHTG